MVVALTIAGQSLVGADVGGFFKHPNAEMATRWYQLAVLAYPFFRNHAHLEQPRREPFTYDDAAMKRMKAAVQLRYKLLPLWYTSFRDYHTLGHPVVRPLFWDFVHDQQTHTHEQAVESQIMLSDVLLAHAVTAPISEKSTSTVYLPTLQDGSKGGWYDLHTGQYYESGEHTVQLTMETIPAYYRSGSIVPLKLRARRSSTCMALDPLSLNVYVNPVSGAAQGRVYVDDYRTKNYQDGKSFLDIAFEFKEGTLRATKVDGALPADDTAAAEVDRVTIFGLKNSMKKATLTVQGQADKELPVSHVAKLPASGELYTGIIKLTPFLDLRKGLSWSIKVE
jgi:alpha 1,3-glucosidase